MTDFVQLQSADGFNGAAYVAKPAGPARGAVVVLQEIFGVNSHIRAVADRFAAQGYLAVAPATFERVQRNVDLGYLDADMQTGMALKTAVSDLPNDAVMQDIQAAIDYAAEHAGGKKVALIGFCWGGLLTWRAACTLTGLSAAIAYYGGGITTPEEIARQPACPVLAHFGAQDHWIPLEGVSAFSAAHPEVEVHIYPANHGFNCDQRGSYNAAAAQLARERSLAFLQSTIG